MTTPLLNEHLLMQALHPKSQASPETVRGLFKLLVLDCYDRKVTRECFFEVLNRSVQALRDIHSLECSVHIQKVFAECEPGEPARMNDVLARLFDKVDAHRQWAFDKMDLLIQCPYTGDSIS